MKYTYQPIVRTPMGDDGKPNPLKHPYMKMKLLTEFPTNEIRTSIIEQTDDGGRFLNTDTQTIDESKVHDSSYQTLDSSEQYY